MVYLLLVCVVIICLWTQSFLVTFREVSSSVIPYRHLLSTSWRRSSHCTILTTDSPWWKRIMRRYGKPFLSLLWLCQYKQYMYRYKIIKLFLLYLSGIVFIVSGQKSQYRVLVSHLVCLLNFIWDKPAYLLCLIQIQFFI